VTVRQTGQVVLDRLDLVVPAGAIVAVVGRSGAGKSLLAALAGRLLDPDEGEVLIDGVPLRELGRGELRRAVQYAFARPALLGDSIGGAIRFGGTVPAPGLVEAAARAACADSFIRRLPNGYETPLGEVPMSGGEVQRIGLARAFAHAPGARLLILDDATSSLDTVTEMQVTRALTEQLDQTRLVIAHRAATAARAGWVAWLDAGRVRACGSHRELWTDPEYRATFEPTR
jgi:ATP-binding cassette subfamily B protein